MNSYASRAAAPVICGKRDRGEYREAAGAVGERRASSRPISRPWLYPNSA
jgi:hypothetical protein